MERRKRNLRKLSLRKLISYLSLIIHFSLSACAGDEELGANEAEATDLASGYTVHIALFDQITGLATTTIGTDHPGELRISIETEEEPVVNELVSLSILDESLASFSSGNGNIITDSSGEARVQILATSTDGASTIKAMIITDTGNELTVELNFKSNGGHQAPITLETIQFGSTVNNEFISGLLSSSISNLSAGATSSIQGEIIDQNGNTINQPISVTFTSNCINQQLALIDESVISINGWVSSTYRASGCVGTDQIFASFEYGGNQYSATTSIIIAEDTPGSITFVDANPTQIVLVGTGGLPSLGSNSDIDANMDIATLSETSQVRFRVLGLQGHPVANQIVNFSLSTQIGGLSLTSDSALTNSDGYAITTVNAGSIPTSVIVIASLAGLNIATQSASLSVSSGVPDNDSFSLSIDELAPEGLNIDGKQVNVSVYAADFFNNPVPDGIPISFTVEGGNIEPSCLTVEGSCSVVWTSQNPRPLDGRVTILATTIGAESFYDENANGVFDNGDTLFDLEEAFRDDNNSNSRETGEPYLDFNVNGNFDAANNLYDGPRCEDTLRCSDRNGIHVRDSLVFIMAGSNAVFEFSPPNNNNFNGQNSVSITVTVKDINNNSIPTGSTIDVSSSKGRVTSSSQIIIPNQRGIHSFRVDIDLTDASPLPGSNTRSTLSLLVTTPQGTTSSEIYDYFY